MDKANTQNRKSRRSTRRAKQSACKQTPKPFNSESGIVTALDEISKDISAIELNYTESLGTELQRIVQNSKQLEKSTAEWERFCEASKWQTFKKKTPSSDDPRNHLYYTLRYVCGPDPKQQKNACFYRSALSVLLADKVAVHRIATEIKIRGGLREIVDANRARESEMADEIELIKQPVDEPELDDHGQLESNEGLERKSNPKSVLMGNSHKSAAAQSNGGIIKKDGKSLRDRKSEVHVECKPQYFEMLMQLDEGDQVDCTIEAVDRGESRFVRLRLTDIREI